MSSLDYLDLCRLCLVKDRVSVPIFEGEGDVRQIFLKIAACLPVKVGREDKLPKKICDDCVYKVELFYQFWNTTANAEKQLLQWLGDVSLDDKQGYVTGAHPSLMKPGQNPGENRLDGSVMQQVNDHPNNMGMGMLDSMGMGMPMMINTSGQQQQPQQQMTSVPMDSGGVQTVQAVPGPSTQSSHDQRKTSTNQEDDEDDSEEDDNSDDECDGDDGMAVKEESEEDPTNSRTIEPTTFVNVSLACDEAGPSGLQQQKIGEMPEMVMPPTDGDPKSGEMCEERRSARGKTSKTESKKKKTEKRTKSVPPPKRKSKRAVKTKRKVAVDANTDNDSTAEEENPPKKQKIGRRTRMPPVKKQSKKKYDDSSQDFDIDSDKEPSKFVEITIKEEVDDDSSRDWLDSDDGGPKSVEITKKSYDCRTCGASYKRRCLYNKHLLTHSNLRPYECPTCHKKFKYNFGLTRHIKQQHSDVAPHYTCKMCEFTTKHEYYLQIHFARKHTEETKYKCNICGKTFKVVGPYRVHMNDHENGPQVCDICGISYPNKTSLYDHRYYKHMEKNHPFQCTVCKKHFSTEKNLETHMEQHNQTYVCEECGKKFAKKPCLAKHRKVHREKMYLCPVCGRAFANKTTQRVHMITHSGVRPYICDVCGLNFTQRSSLMIHWKKTHPEASQAPPPVTLRNIVQATNPNAN